MKQLIIALCICIICTSAHGISCNINQYINNDLCYTCPVNAQCDGINFTCNNGFYKDGTICTACPISNSTCTGPDNFSCMTGYYLLDGKCTTCPKNATCDGGDKWFRCNNGFYPNASNICKSCGLHACSDGQLVECTDGYYFHATLKECFKCSTGAYCPAGTWTNIGVKCLENWYGDNAICNKCEDGYYCPFGTSNKEKHKYCAIGYYRAGSFCVACPPDQQCVGTYPDNMKCSDGLYAHLNGKCLPYAENDPGVSGACNPGYYDNGSECLMCSTANSTCSSATDFKCNAGYFKSGDICRICPENADCDDDNGITCDKGYYLNNFICSTCDSGYYCDSNKKTKCPAFDNNIVNLGPNDTVYDFTGPRSIAYSSDISGCQITNVYVHSDNSDYFLANIYYNGTEYDAQSANKGYLSAKTGYYLSDEMQLNLVQMYRHLNACTNAPDNSHYTGSGTPNSNDCPWICDDDFYRDGNTCQSCPPGQNCAGGRVVCPVGQYADKNVCVDCPEYWHDNPNSGLESINQCQKKCDAGMYVVGNACVNVGAGYYNPINYTNYGDTSIRHKCPDNLTTTGYGTGADEESDCGKVLHFGKYSLYLRSSKTTSPSLAVQYGNRILYGSMSRDKRGHLRTEYNGEVYSIFNPDVD